MTTPEGLQMRTEFTFFPEGPERAKVERASATTLFMFALEQPELTYSFFHELWRQNRDDDAFVLARLLGRELFEECIGNTLIADTALILRHYEISSEARKFVQRLLELHHKISNGMSDQDEIPPLDSIYLQYYVGEIILQARIKAELYWHAIARTN